MTDVASVAFNCGRTIGGALIDGGFSGPIEVDDNTLRFEHPIGVVVMITLSVTE